MGEEKQRMPPNQRVTSKFPVLHEGPIPKFDPKTWDFVVEGLVKNPVRLTYEEFLKLPKVVSVSDFLDMSEEQKRRESYGKEGGCNRYRPF